jgi:hypothetical protein
MATRLLCRGWFFAGMPGIHTLMPTHCNNWAKVAVYLIPAFVPAAHVCGIHRNSMQRAITSYPGMVRFDDYE